jgi:hypothetical protein
MDAWIPGVVGRPANVLHAFNNPNAKAEILERNSQNESLPNRFILFQVPVGSKAALPLVRAMNSKCSN